MTAAPCLDPEHLSPPQGTAEGQCKHIAHFKATTIEPKTTNTASVTTKHLFEVMERKLSELALFTHKFELLFEEHGIFNQITAPP